jgi:phenylacetate-CoA ligase
MSRYLVKRRLYELLPAILKIPIGWVPFGSLAGSSYRENMARGRQMDRASREELLAYQEQALGKILEFATDQVAAYRPFRASVERLRPFEALKAFPLLDKEHLQQHFPDYLPRDLDRILHYECSTGGTSGNQLNFHLDDSSQAIEMAFMHRQWARVGYHHRSTKATFRGVEFSNISRHVFWQRNPVYNELQFSPYHMNPSTLGTYVDKLLEFQPDYIHGYPSAIAILARYILMQGVSVNRLKIRAVLLGSEGLDPGQAEVIESALKARAFSWYGHSERLVLAGECEKTRVYHHFPDYGVLELTAEDGSPVTEDGGAGEIVGTGLYNRSLPLIRYRTGDRARRRDCRCSCRRAFDRFDQVEGRWQQEFIIGRQGSKISLAALNMHGPFFDNVIRYQYYQDRPGTMELRVMVNERFTDENIGELQKAFERKTGDELGVTVRVVEEISLTARGKLQRLISRVPPPDSEGS